MSTKKLLIASRRIKDFLAIYLHIGSPVEKTMRRHTKYRSLYDDQKYCPKCQKAKMRSEFYNNRATSDGLEAYCKKCKADMEREKRRANPIANRINARMWDMKHRAERNVKKNKRAQRKSIVEGDMNYLEEAGLITKKKEYQKLLRKYRRSKFEY